VESNFCQTYSLTFEMRNKP